MADGRVDGPDQAMLKAAQNEISSVLSNAMGHMTPAPSQSNETPKKGTSAEAQGTAEDLDYVQPMQDPYNKAIKYLENHNILQLFQVLSFEALSVTTDQIY